MQPKENFDKNPKERYKYVVVQKYVIPVRSSKMYYTTLNVCFYMYIYVYST